MTAEDIIGASVVLGLLLIVVATTIFVFWEQWPYLVEDWRAGARARQTLVEKQRRERHKIY